MNTFPCSSCKKPIHAADDLVGKSILCPHCGLATTVANAAITTPNSLPTYPSSTGVTTASGRASTATSDPDDREQMPDVRFVDTRLRSMLTIFMVVAMLTTILGTLVALFVPPVMFVRDADARTQSINNLKNIGLATHSFHDVIKRLPFNGSDLPFKDVQYQAEAAAGKATSGSWAFQLVPYIESGPLFNNPANLRDQEGPLAYMCPGRGRPRFEARGGGVWTDYFYNNYLNDPKQASKPDCADMRRTLIGITDGSSNTVLVGHGNVSTDQYSWNTNVTLSTNIFRGGTTGTMRSGDNGETAPGGVTLQRDSANLPIIGSWGGPFSQGALMGMADGTVRMFPYNTQNFSSFLTPTGGEQVMLPDT